jgi:hypothetical protein
MSNNIFEIARRDLIAAIAAMPVPSPIDVDPLAKQFEDVGEHIHYMARLVDVWLRRIGAEVASNSTSTCDMRCFTEQFTGAVEGFALFEVSKAAEQVRADAEEMV